MGDMHYPRFDRGRPRQRADEQASLDEAIRNIQWLLASRGVRVAVRITSVDSPFTLTSDVDVLFVDTDGGAITVNLPSGYPGRTFRLINCGSSLNNVTVTPDGSETVNGSSSATITDSGSLLITFETTEGWW